MTSSGLPEPIDRVDIRITSTLARIGVPVVRMALGIVFLWFGVLKFFPDLSPAQDLAARTIRELTGGAIRPEISLPVLAAWESVIGIGLILGRWLRPVLFLLALQMAGTFTPLLLFPEETFTVFPFVPTLEGQYIIKNFVLIGAAMVVGATVRGGQIVAEPPRRQPPSDVGPPGTEETARYAPPAGVAEGQTRPT